MSDRHLTDRTIRFRRHLHRNPELSNCETETQSYIRDELADIGLTNIREVAGTGIVVDVIGTAGPSNRKIAIRADIDALPIAEETGLDFSSASPGVMHACGHDAHTAMVLSAAAKLHQEREGFRGTVRLIFQPAEEAEPLGGRRIIEAGLLEDVDAAVGIHVDPYLEAGKIAVAPGSYTLACDIFDIEVKGSSAHAAKPHEGTDAIAIGCAIVAELQMIVSRETDALTNLIISVTGFSGGGAYNIIADRVQMKGTVRSSSGDVRSQAHARLREITEGVARLHGGAATIRFVMGEPPVINDAEMVELIERSAGEIIGKDNVQRLGGWSAADDFGFYSEKRPAVYFRLGVRNEAKGAVYPLHHPKFQIDEDALPIGVRTLVTAARTFLAG
jgi:amidohydrolase